MKYAAVHRLWLHDQPAYSDGNCKAIGAWALLSVYASDRELGEGDGELGVARITDCEDWPDRKWITAAGVSCEDVAEADVAGLVKWDGRDLLVLGYDVAGERKVAACRTNGGLGGRPKKPRDNPQDNPGDNPQVKLTGTDGVTQAITQTKPPTLPSPAPPPPTAGGLSRPEEAANIYAKVSGNTDLPPMSCNWNHAKGRAVGAMVEWAARAEQLPDYSWQVNLRAELTLLKRDKFIAGSPIHIWADRLGTGKSKATADLPEGKTFAQRMAEERENPVDH